MLLVNWQSKLKSEATYLVKAAHLNNCRILGKYIYTQEKAFSFFVKKVRNRIRCLVLHNWWTSIYLKLMKVSRSVGWVTKNQLPLLMGHKSPGLQTSCVPGSWIPKVCPSPEFEKLCKKRHSLFMSRKCAFVSLWIPTFRRNTYT